MAEIILSFIMGAIVGVAGLISLTFYYDNKRR